MRTLLFAVLMLALAVPVAAGKFDNVRYQSPEGWRFQVGSVWDIEARVDMARSRGLTAIPPVMKMMQEESRGQYDWLECGVVIKEGVLLKMGPSTEVEILYGDSLRVTSRRLLFPDYTFMQYWDTPAGEIWLGLTGNKDLYHKVAKAQGFTEQGKVKAIVYVAFVLIPAESGLTRTNVMSVSVRGARVRSAETN